MSSDKPSKGRKMKLDNGNRSKVSAPVLFLLILLIVGGLGAGAFFAYNHFFGDPMGTFSEHISAGRFAEASELFHSRLAEDAGLRDEAVAVVTDALFGARNNLAEGAITHTQAVSVWHSIRDNINILDEEVMIDVSRSLGELQQSINLFESGRSAYIEENWQGAIDQLRRVRSELVSHHGAAMLMLDSASLNFRNNVISNLHLDLEYIETYEAAILQLQDALRTLPGDLTLLSTLDQINQVLDAVTFTPPEPYEPERTPTPNTTWVENVRFNYSSAMTGYFTGEVSNANNRPFGFGTFTFDPAISGRGVYIGEFGGTSNPNSRHGFGRNEFPNGTVYEGGWDNGWFHGTGTFWYLDGYSVTSDHWARSSVSNRHAIVRNALGEIVFEGNVTADQNSFIRGQ